MFKKNPKRLLKRYIRECKNKNMTEEEIKEILMKVGWSEEQLEELFEEDKRKTIEVRIPLRKKEPVVEEVEKEEKKAGISDRLSDIDEKLDMITQTKKVEKRLKKKQFKIPFKVRSQLKKLALKNKVQVMLLQRTRNIKPTIGEIKEGMLLVGDKIHDCSAHAVWLWNGKYPTVIVPEWDLKPITPEDLYEEAVEHKRLADPQTIMIRAMEFRESLAPKKLSSKTIIFILIGGIIVFYVLFSQGG